MSREASTALAEQLHTHCIACAKTHPWGLHLHFEPWADGVQAETVIHESYQGYNGLVHGGIIASILDAAMTHCLLQQGLAALTAQLSIRYKRPLPVNQLVKVSASVNRMRPPLYEVRATLTLDNQVVAFASARFMDAPADFNPPAS